MQVNALSRVLAFLRVGTRLTVDDNFFLLWRIVHIVFILSMGNVLSW